jgi:hypothetical protein
VSSIAKEVFVEDAEKERGIIFLSGTVSREIVIKGLKMDKSARWFFGLIKPILDRKRILF